MMLDVSVDLSTPLVYTYTDFKKKIGIVRQNIRDRKSL